MVTVINNKAPPSELIKYRQWVVWRFEIREGKQTKIPYQVDGTPASSTDAETWTSYDEAIKALSIGRFDGIGFVVTPTDKYCGIDLDHCRNAETGEIEPKKLDIIKQFDSYTEVTPSNTGLRVWIKAKLSDGGRKRNVAEHIEIYDQGRFFTVTGQHLEGTPTTIEARQNELNQLYAAIFPPEVKEKRQSTAIPVELADTELISKAMAAKNGPLFSRLWNGDTSGHNGDDSSADLALCSILAFWTGNDESRIDSLFRQSGLYRKKWEREDYRTRTIKKAISQNIDVYKGDNTYMYISNGTKLSTHERDKNGTENGTGESKGEAKTGQNKNVPMSDRIREWIRGTSGWFATDELDKDLGIITPQDKENRRKIMLRLREDNFIEPHEKINKQFRYVNTKVTSLNFKTANTAGILPIKWPLNEERLVNFFPGNIACIAGAPNAGKTAYMLDFIYLNQAQFPIYYFCSEMGEVELRDRLDKFPGMDIDDWKFEAIERSSDFPDVIRPDCVNIIDFVEMTTDLYQINTILTAISHKIGTGVAVVAIQKKAGAAFGRGQEFGLEKPKLYLSMDKGKISIIKGKSWVDKQIDPNGLSIKFSIENGCLFKPTEGWYTPDGREVLKPEIPVLSIKTGNILPATCKTACNLCPDNKKVDGRFRCTKGTPSQ